MNDGEKGAVAVALTDGVGVVPRDTVATGLVEAVGVCVGGGSPM